MISLLIFLLILFLVGGVILWAIQTLPIPPPFGVVAQAIVAVILLLVVVDVLFGGRYLGMPRFYGP